jgi:AAA domain/UvrD-like helicase C-terminal domain/Nuclease-related domain
MTAVAGAGRSQAEEAQRARLRIAEYERHLCDERARLRRHQIASRTEKQVAARLSGMSVWGWHLLPDRHWSSRDTRPNVDMLLVGPGGVLVVDVKAWRELRIENGILYRGDEDASDEVDTLLRITGLVEDALAPLALAPVQVEPVLVLAGRRLDATRIGRPVVLGEMDVVNWANRRGRRLTVDEVTTVVATLEDAFPPYEVTSEPPAAVVVPEPVLPRQPTREDEQLELLHVADLEDSLIEFELAKPIEQWMTFLHPDQHAIVRRAANGPSRVRGAAGTGKTVVGLHRAAYLATTRPGRLLFVSYVRTLPTVLSSQYARLSPHTAGRVEFVGIHAWAYRFLRERGVRVNLDGSRARQLFNRTWASVGRYSALAGLPLHPDYWHDEVVAVVKGRGLTRYQDYAGLQRFGRRTPLRAEHRAAVWDLYQAYDVALRQAGVHDFSDLLAMALTEVRARPLDDPYIAVLVDEVQDLTCVGLQLMHALGGDGPEGLHLIGDGQQSVYPGGYRLAEAGIDVRGRSAVLRTNYRNAAEVAATAATLVAGDDFDDLESTEQGTRDVSITRSGGETVRVDATDLASHDAALIAALRDATSDGTTTLGDCAVLALTTSLARSYRRVLTDAGLTVVDLEEYDGQISDRVKVGTVKRSKGLEFKQVFLPRLSDEPPRQRMGEMDSAYVERAALWRRELFVGMTRARDLLWLGYLSGPAVKSGH